MKNIKAQIANDQVDRMWQLIFKIAPTLPCRIRVWTYRVDNNLRDFIRVLARSDREILKTFPKSSR